MPNTTNTQSRKGTTARYVIAGITSGTSRIVDRATAQAVSGATEKAVAKHKRQKRRGAIEAQEYEKKLTGAGFGIIVGLAIVKDILDILFNFTVVLALLASFAGIVISFVVIFYLIYNDVKWTTRKMVAIIITFVIEFIPIVNALIPAATINLFIIRKFENSDRFKEFIEKKTTLLAKI